MKIKKILAAVTAIALGASLCGCSGGETADSADKPLIITTIFPAYDFARQVFGDTAEVRMLLKLRPVRVQRWGIRPVGGERIAGGSGR